MKDQYRPVYAHTPPKGSTQWHLLDEHLLQVASRASNFAKVFNASEIAYLLGLWHDLGKLNPEFQNYLIAQYEGRQHPSIPHAIWGAALAYRLFSQGRWQEIALPILGHHAGLHDMGDASAKLCQFLQQQPNCLLTIKEALKNLNASAPNFKLSVLAPHQREFFIRMTFSALVDADYLDTESHFNPVQAERRAQYPSLETLWEKLQTAQQGIINDTTPVNRIRREVYEACLQSAPLPPGLFRLTVPTGGGKTRSGLAFALRHALENTLRRVVVAIPYTSITTQTAQTYRDILGKDALLEHHSAVPLPDDTSDRQDTDYMRRKLASENWDAHLIVTTTVQLFESLFANHPGKVRKLHRLARAVIILDEVQTLPPELLASTLDVLKLLATPVEAGGYGATVVLCTATQPAFEDSRWLEAFQGTVIQEIVPDYRRHFAELEQLGRVSYSRRPDKMEWHELAEEIRQREQILVVLNTRKNALALLDALGKAPDVFHLSTLLCGAHRQNILVKVKARLDLNNPQPVRLISTQVVEAGVDLDFPEVWRATGPLDRIVQAAGRCNREGLRATGKVVIFDPVEGGAPRGPYKVGMAQANFLLETQPIDRLHDPEIFRDYFKRVFDIVDTDRKRIQSYRAELNYPEVARRYRLIESDTVTVVAPYGEGLQRLEEWKTVPTQRNWQQLQPYLVNLFRHEVREKQEWLEPVTPDLYVWTGGYDNTLGLIEGFSDPADLMV
ncbi:MAG: CRISPR-associated endonuclease Cas3'' [Pseudomonadota bacterium]|nr:CRISPR-associated endonuclease Cas3'' [Pseudomonadota bacterium]